MRRLPDGARLVALLVGLAACQAGRLQAATFSVNPTQVFLSARAPSALVSLRNESREPLRFQLSVQGWDQRPDGEMTLTPTQDILFFPQLLTLAPGEERKVRLGLTSAARPAAVERTYRLFVEELPSSEPENQGAGVRMLTRMSLPVFVQPASATAKASLADVGAGGGHVTFTARNVGTAHFVPEAITLEGVGADGHPVFTQSVNGWYILAGGTRRFDVAVPAGECARVAFVRVSLRVGATTVTERLETPSGSCRP